MIPTGQKGSAKVSRTAFTAWARSSLPRRQEMQERQPAQAVLSAAETGRAPVSRTAQAQEL